MMKHVDGQKGYIISTVCIHFM